MSENDVKAKIAKLIDKYEQVVQAGRLKAYSEEDTKKDFILPLFEYLGWDTSNRNEVTSEENIVGTRLDYGFYLNGQPKFFLEAKKLRADLNAEAFANQAIKYSWNRDVTWAVLTDFESLIVFNAQNIDSHLGDKQYFKIPYNEYLDRFDQLWLLSKEAFEGNQLDEAATRVGKKLQRVSVTTTLYKDLNKARELLTAGLSQCNPTVSGHDLDEGIQKLLDRIIFLRVAEDRKLEPPTLRPLIRAYYTKEKAGQNLYETMIGKFRELNETYNSNLFDEHPFEKWEEYSGKTEDAINLFYGKKGYYEYDFSAIPADILGTVYENYLGHQLAQSQKGVSISKDAKKRKEQGIYYTPTYIVDYIVTNALEPVLDKCKSIHELKQIKVLDPACGSGSFLLKALEVIADKYKEFLQTEQLDVFTKVGILTQNLYGVDLDDKAVDIARLNLLIACLDEKTKFPGLENNIKQGNSLISGTDEELKKYFGKNFRDKKPFNWEQEFPEVFNRPNPGFDVVIGNPPYISFYSKQSQATSETADELHYYINHYKFIEEKSKLGRFNTLMFFFEISIRLLVKGGRLSFIVDNNIHSNPSLAIRRYITKYRIESVADEIKAFAGVASSQAILSLVKDTASAQDQVIWYALVKGEFVEAGRKLQNQILQDNFSFKQPAAELTNNLIQKLRTNKSLESLLGKSHIRTCITFTGKKEVFVKNKKISEIDYPLLEGSKSLPYPYAILKSTSFVTYDTSLRDILNKEYVAAAKQENKRSPKVIGLGNLTHFKAPKIFVRLSDTRITASLTKDFFVADLSLYIITLPNLKIANSKLSLYSVLALLNSKLVTFYMRKSHSIKNLGTGTPQIRLADIRSIPTPDITMNSNKVLSRFAKTMITLNQTLLSLTVNSNKWHTIKSEIEKTDRQIDQLVYKLYGLTDTEIQIVEGNEKAAS